MVDDRDSEEDAPEPRFDTGRLLLVAVLVLAVVCTGVLVVTSSAAFLRLGVLGGLWAAMLGVFLATRYRKQVVDKETEAAEQQSVYQLELEREVAARREYELEIEAETRRRIQEESRDDLAALRKELFNLRETLERLTGGEVLVERFALRAQSTRMRSFGENGPPMVTAGMEESRRGVAAGQAKARSVLAGDTINAGTELIEMPARVNPPPQRPAAGRPGPYRPEPARPGNRPGEPVRQGPRREPADRRDTIPSPSPEPGPMRPGGLDEDAPDPRDPAATKLSVRPVGRESGFQQPAPRRPEEPGGRRRADGPRPDRRPESRPDRRLEPPRAEPPRADPLRVDPLRVDANRPERSEPLRPGPLARGDQGRPGPARADTRAEALRADALRAESLRPDGLRPEAIRPEAIRPEAMRPEGMRADALRGDGPEPRRARRGEPRPADTVREPAPSRLEDTGSQRLDLRPQPSAGRDPMVDTGSQRLDLVGPGAERVGPPGRRSKHLEPVGEPQHSEAARDSQRLDSPRHDSQRLDSARLDSQRLDSQRLDSQRLDSPRLDSPRVDSQRLDPPGGHRRDEAPAREPLRPVRGAGWSAGADRPVPDRSSRHRTEDPPAALHAVPPAEPDAGRGGHRRAEDRPGSWQPAPELPAPEPEEDDDAGAHAAGRSVTELLAAHGAEDSGVRRRRRRAD